MCNSDPIASFIGNNCVAFRNSPSKRTANANRPVCYRLPKPSIVVAGTEAPPTPGVEEPNGGKVEPDGGFAPVPEGTNPPFAGVVAGATGMRLPPTPAGGTMGPAPAGVTLGGCPSGFTVELAMGGAVPSGVVTPPEIPLPPAGKPERLEGGTPSGPDCNTETPSLPTGKRASRMGADAKRLASVCFLAPSIILAI